MYVCGPTVYGRIHIGNGRAAVVFDVLYRLLRARYPEVVYVRNITDVDDKINQTAAELGEPIGELTERYIGAYAEDMAALGNLPPTLEPRATRNIETMIAMIAELIERGYAYPADGHVLFDVTAEADYGRLSRHSLDDMIAGARVEVAPYKRHPADFVLWKPSSDDLPGWDSPWGRGRPGWHIECSAMIRAHLGRVIDIHGGGRDLTFPHHENELAQSTCIDGSRDYVRYWLHNGMLTVEDEKMSKSLGNIVTVADLLTRYDGEVLRYALLSGHYRSELNWSEELIGQAQSSLERLYHSLERALERAPAAAESAAEPAGTEAPRDVVTALEDDLNTPEALAALHRVAHALNRAEDPAARARAAAELKAGAALLGLLRRSPEAYFRGAAADDALDAATIEQLIDERAEARRRRDFPRADAIRDQLNAAGVELEDGPDGTRWRYARTGG